MLEKTKEAIKHGQSKDSIGHTRQKPKHNTEN
jgi:hypothetical protein